MKTRDRIGLSSHYFFSFAALGFVSAFLPLFLKDRGLTLTEIGVLGAIYAFAGASVQIPFGALSDRLGSRKPLVMAAAILLGVTYLIFQKIRGFQGFCAVYLVAGILFYTIATLTSALLSDWTAGTRSTGRSYGITRIWGSTGFIVTLAIISLIPSLTKGSNLLPAIAGLFCLGGLSIGIVVEPGHSGHQKRSLFNGLPILLKNRNLAVFLMTFFLYRLCESGSMSFLSIYLQELGGSRSLIALAYALAAIVEIPFMLWVGGVSDRVGRRPPLVIAFLAMPIRLLLYSHLRNAGGVFYVQLLHGLTFSFMLVASLAFVADLSPGDLRATGQGLLGMTSGLAMTLGPLLGGVFADHISISSMYLVLAGTAVTAGLIFISFVHESHPEIGAQRLEARAAARHPLIRGPISLLSEPLIGGFTLTSRVDHP